MMEAPTLFDVFVRTDLERASRVEPKYGWWNRSAWPEVESSRQELETWLGRYPAGDRAELVGRFRSNDDDLHGAALFELFIHEHLVRAGLSVECHPRVPGTGKVPDFLARGARWEGLYVEAASTGASAASRRGERLKDEAIEVVDSLRSTEFWASVMVTGAATGSLPLGRTRFREKLLAWLRNLDHKALLHEQRTNPYGRRPVFLWKAAGLRLELKAWAKDPDAAGGPVERLLASEVAPARFMPPGHAMLARTIRES